MLANLGVAASLALAASAVLVPPNVASENLGGDDGSLELIAIDPFKRTVALECPGCSLAVASENGISWTAETGNSFLLDFEVGEREESLEIDGVQLYPPSFGHFPDQFFVTQVGPQTGEPLRLRVTGYTFHYNSAETVSEAGTELLPMNFKITSIESRTVDPPALTINLLKDASGRLMIASFQTTSAADESPIEQDKECREWPLLCKWKSIIADRIQGMKTSMGKGCHKNMPGNPMAEGTTKGKPPHRFRPGQHHPQHHPGHRHHRNHRMHVLRRAFFTVVIPILLGIFAGTITYLIGLSLGCLIAVVVTKIRGSAPYESVAQDDVEAEPSSEKEVFVEPPQYDAPPVYEVAAEKEVVDESH